MKLKLFDKIVLILAILLSIFLLGALIFACWSHFFAQDITSYLLAVLVGPTINRVIITIAAALMIFLLLRILFVRKKDKRDDTVLESPKRDSDQIHIRSNEMGESYITKDALLDMVQKGARANPNVRDSNAVVESDPVSGHVSVRLEVFPQNDSNLPALSDELQKSVKENVEVRTGISLDDVKVIFASRPNGQSAGNQHNARTLR